MRNAKLLLLSVVTAISALGCTIQTRNGVKEVPYDYSDYAYYDKPFATSPDYREAKAEMPPPVAENAERPAPVFPKAAPAAATAAGAHRTHAAHAGSTVLDGAATKRLSE